MAIVTTDDKHYKDIANKIRDYAFTSKTYTPEEMANGVDEVYNVTYAYAHESGYQEGISVGFEDGKSKGIAEGAKAEYDRFWDELQQNGERRNYWGAFCSWTDEIFKPKYPIVANTNNSMFYLSTVTHIPVIDFSGATALNSTFAYASVAVVIEKIILKNDGSQVFSTVFNGCKALERVAFEGVIGNNITFHDSTKFSHDSIVNVFGALSSTASGKTVTFSRTAVNKAFEQLDGANDGASSAEWQDLIATRSNWTISLA